MKIKQKDSRRINAKKRIEAKAKKAPRAAASSLLFRSCKTKRNQISEKMTLIHQQQRAEVQIEGNDIFNSNRLVTRNENRRKEEP